MARPITVVSWNGVSGSVRGLFYGDPGQLIAQLIGVGTLLGGIFCLSYAANYVIDLVVGQRVSAEDEPQVWTSRGWALSVIRNSS